LRNPPDMFILIKLANRKGYTEDNLNNFTYTLISTSTPLGNSSFIKASIVLDEEL